jgi:hypothetical protein
MQWRREGEAEWRGVSQYFLHCSLGAPPPLAKVHEWAFPFERPHDREVVGKRTANAEATRELLVGNGPFPREFLVYTGFFGFLPGAPVIDAKARELLLTHLGEGDWDIWRG